MHEYDYRLNPVEYIDFEALKNKFEETVLLGKIAKITREAIFMSRFIEIDREEIPVSEEVYKAYMQPIWREQKRIQRAYEDLNEMDDDSFANSGKILKQSNSGNGTGLHHHQQI